MSAKTFSRDFADGKVKHLRRMKQPLALTLQLPAPRNPVVRALAQHAIRTCLRPKRGRVGVQSG
jgi:hypothetical protein